MMYKALQNAQPHKGAIEYHSNIGVMSQRSEIKASVAGLLEANILYLAMIDDNERKRRLCFVSFFVTHRLSVRGMCVGVDHGILRSMVYLASELF